VKDFNFNSFRIEVAPLALFLNSEVVYPVAAPASYAHVLVRIGPDEIQETIATIEESMAEFSPGYPLDFHFLDDAYNDMYKAEIRLGGLFGYFTAIALFIACLGLLGLAAFTVSQRTKEIGMRKALGASVRNIVTLLSTDFLKLVGAAIVVGVPPAYIVVHRWLEGFAYRIDVGIGVFLVAGGIVLVIAIVTVGYSAIKAALADPVKSLRYE
jgi:putative ABC transport system permease protein